MGIQALVQGKWLGTYVATTSYGIFKDRVSLEMTNDTFAIIYYDKNSIRSAAKGTFVHTEGFITLTADQEKLSDGDWCKSHSSLKFSFSHQQDKITLEATDILGVHKKIVVTKA